MVIIITLNTFHFFLILLWFKKIVPTVAEGSSESNTNINGALSFIKLP